MTSVYDKMYPQIPATALPDDESYRLKKVKKNSQTFVQNSKFWLIEEDEVQVSYDVVNLYPSVPVKEATDIIIQILSSNADLKN